MNEAGAFAGVLVMGGVALLYAAMATARPVRLAEALRKLEEPSKPKTSLRYQDLIDRLSARGVALFKESDLAILGLTRTEVVGSTVAVCAVAGAVLLVAGGMLSAGVVPMGTLGFLSLAAFMVAVVVAKVIGPATSAAKRRKEARAAITVWLNFVALAVTFHPVEASIPDRVQRGQHLDLRGDESRSRRGPHPQAPGLGRSHSAGQRLEPQRAKRHRRGAVACEFAGSAGA